MPQGIHVGPLIHAVLTIEFTVIGFIWTFSLKFPYSVRSLHYRRCLLSDATHVAIAVTDPQTDDNEMTFNQNYIRGLRTFFSSFFAVVHEAMTFLFSDRNSFGCPRSSNGHFSIVPVLTDPDDGTRYIIFRFRRYILEGDRFLPGTLNKFNFLQDIVKANDTKGLADAVVKENRRVVGENHISMRKPMFLRCLKNEICKPFYTYQIFMIWSVSDMIAFLFSAFISSNSSM